MLRLASAATLVLTFLCGARAHGAEPDGDAVPPPVVTEPTFAANQLLTRTVNRTPPHGAPKLLIQPVTGERWIVVHTEENWEPPGGGPSFPRSTTIFALAPATGRLRSLTVPTGRAFEYGFGRGGNYAPHAVVFYLRRFELALLPANRWQRSAWRWDLETGAVTPLLQDAPPTVIGDYIGLARAADHFQFDVAWTDDAERKWTGTMVFQPRPALGRPTPQTVRIDGNTGYRFITCPNRTVVTSERPTPEEPVRLRCFSIDNVSKTLWTTTIDDFAARMNVAAKKLHIYVVDGMEEAGTGVIPCLLQVLDGDDSHAQVWLVDVNDGSIKRRVLPQAVLYYQVQATASSDGRRFFLREHDFYGSNPQIKYDGRDVADHVYDLVEDRDVFYQPLPPPQRIIMQSTEAFFGRRVIIKILGDERIFSFDPEKPTDVKVLFDLQAVVKGSENRGTPLDRHRR